jgi:hypothetical protein
MIPSRAGMTKGVVFLLSDITVCIRCPQCHSTEIAWMTNVWLSFFLRKSLVVELFYHPHTAINAIFPPDSRITILLKTREQALY